MENQTIKAIKGNSCSIALQAAALGTLLFDRRLSAGLIGLDILYLGVQTGLLLKQRAGMRTCRRCGMEFEKKSRVCPSCGTAYGRVDSEKELAAVIAGENKKEAENNSEEVNRDFERIEEMSAERALSLDEAGIEEILMEKMRRDDGV